jgi:hypothetical protein
MRIGAQCYAGDAFSPAALDVATPQQVTSVVAIEMFGDDEKK